MKTLRTDDEITKEIIVPFVNGESVFDQPTLELPLPMLIPDDYDDGEKTLEITLRGVWTVDI
jgi:hypothetical protein